MNIYFVSTAQEPMFGLFVIATNRNKAKNAGALEMDEEYINMRTRLARKNIKPPSSIARAQWDWRIINELIIYEDNYEMLAEYGLRYATEEEIEAAGY